MCEIFLTRGSIKALNESRSVISAAFNNHASTAKLEHQMHVLRVESVSLNTATVDLYDGEESLKFLVVDKMMICTHTAQVLGYSGRFCCSGLRKGLVIMLREWSIPHMTADTMRSEAFIQVDRYESVGFDVNAAELVISQSADVPHDRPDLLHSHGMNREERVTSKMSPRLPERTVSAQPIKEEVPCTSVDSYKKEAKKATVDAVTSENNDLVGDDYECTHRLEQLHEKLARWSCRAYVLAKTEITEFKRINGSTGKVQRVLLRDRTAQLELVLFAPYCERSPFTGLAVGTQYLFANGEVKQSTGKLRKWPFNLLTSSEKAKFRNVMYDIQSCKSLTVRAYPDGCVDLDECDYVCKDDPDAEASPTALFTPDPPKQQQPPQQQLGQKVSNVQSYTMPRLSDVLRMKERSSVTLMAVICELFPFDPNKDTTPSKSVEYTTRQLCVRRIRIVDTSGVEMNVALWGKQAKVFNLTNGAFVLFKNIQVTAYKGVSLSVTRDTIMVCYGTGQVGSMALLPVYDRASGIQAAGHCLNDPVYLALADWWSNTGSAIYK